jgi:hypothetical protein
MRLDAERSSTYRIFTEYRADRPELQLEKRAAPALKVLLDATRRSTGLSVPIPCRGILIPAQMCYVVAKVVLTICATWAFVPSLDHHADSMRLQDAVQTVRYFRRHFFLNLKTLRVDIDESCEFRNSNNIDPGADSQCAHVR